MQESWVRNFQEANSAPRKLDKARLSLFRGGSHFHYISQIEKIAYGSAAVHEGYEESAISFTAELIDYEKEIRRSLGNFAVRTWENIKINFDKTRKRTIEVAGAGMQTSGYSPVKTTETFEELKQEYDHFRPEFDDEPRALWHAAGIIVLEQLESEGLVQKTTTPTT